MTLEVERPPGSAREHVAEAIRINRERGVFYAGLTNGASRSLTRSLIFRERLCLIPMAAFDRWARPFHKRGIPIVGGDFVSMSKIPAVDAPLPFDGVADQSAVEEMGFLLRVFKGDATRAVKQRDFSQAARLSLVALHDVVERQSALGCLFPMTRHLLESIGFGASNAVEYSRRSDGQTERLSSLLVRFQLQGVGPCLGLDAKAQRCHALGAGIIENDIPAIPFEETWGRRARRQRDRRDNEHG